MPHSVRPLLGLLLAGAMSQALAASTDDSTTLLESMRQAYGGARWHEVAAQRASGQESSDGLTGPWQATVDLRNGQYATRMRNDVFATAEGIDANGQWREDVTGMIHPLDSDEARTVAATASWLRRFGFLDAHAPVTYRRLPDAQDNGRTYQRLEATPRDGRVVTLWIDPTTHRVDRAIYATSFLIATERYGDYRTVDGLQLPFSISSSRANLAGNADGESVDTVEHYQLLGSALFWVSST